jgi:hypothetical protein
LCGISVGGRSIISRNVLGGMLEAVVCRADLTMARVCAEGRLRVLLATSVRVDVCVDVCGAHCVGVVRF